MLKHIHTVKNIILELNHQHFTYPWLIP